MKTIAIVITMLASSVFFAQDTSEDELPYYELPESPETFTAGTMAARMVDALGFRFYWASEGLSETDLVYKPNSDVRSVADTIDHILDLSFVIVNSTLNKSNERLDKSTMTYSEKRVQVLFNLKTASDILRQSDDISEYKIKFGDNEFPFWNQVNGPIADAIWHCGQLASFRRSSGNPINPKVNHFSGTVKS